MKQIVDIEPASATVRCCPQCFYELLDPLSDKCPRCFALVPRANTTCTGCLHRAECNIVSFTAK